MDEKLEWLKAQIEDWLDGLDTTEFHESKVAIERFLRHVEAKFQPRGIFDR